MRYFRKKIYIGAGYATTFFGSGRKEFDPKKPMPSFETYLKETAAGTCKEANPHAFDEGFLGSFMAARFLHQANLPGFLPFMVPELEGKPCTGIEGACGTGGRSIAQGVRSCLSELADAVFVAGFEVQNTVKAVYGADILAGAAYYNGERKEGCAHFFPGIFAERAGAYFQAFGEEKTREAMARWYEKMICNARKNPKAQEYANATADLFGLAMAPPDPKNFIPFLNPYNCSKVSDGAASLVVMTEEGRKKCDIEPFSVVELIGLGEAEADITKPPEDLTALTTTKKAVRQALEMADIGVEEIGVLEIHDCFGITALLSIEAIGLAPKGKGGEWLAMEKIPVNPSGGLHGFGHPTGATGVRQMVDLWQQLRGLAANPVEVKTPYGMMVSMGGNDKTVTCMIVKRNGV